MSHSRGTYLEEARPVHGWVRTAASFAPAVLLLVAAATLTLQVTDVRLVVRWEAVPPDDNVLTSLGLAFPRAMDDGAYSYLLVNPSDDALARVQAHPAVRSARAAGGTGQGLRTQVSIQQVPSYAWLIDWRVQSTTLFAIALVLGGASAAARWRVRAAALVVCVALFAGVALLLPLEGGIHMGDSEQYTASRGGFENVFAEGTVGFESHLSSRLLWWLDRELGGDEQSPAAAMALLARVATLWFASMLLLAAGVERFTPAALRYVALAMAAPASLMYFGYRELGYLSLTPAAFPLIAQGIRGARGRIEAGSALAGLGAALHGFGVLSVAGALTAALTARGRAWRDRLGLAGRAMAFATALYLAWIFLYVVVLKLTVLPSDAGELPWRPLFDSVRRGGYVSWALLSVRGAIEVLAGAWMVGVPLALAVPAARGNGDSRLALAFAVPSAVFLAVLWPIQGLAVEADLMVAAFPAIYALAWLAAQSPRTTVLGLALLASSHVVFWRVLFSDAFVASRM